MQQMAVRDKRRSDQRRYNRSAYHKDSEAARARGREYRAANLEDVRVKQKDAAKAKRGDPKYVVRELIYRSRRRAKEIGVECSLEHGDLSIPQVCPIRRTAFVFNSQNHPDAASVDRLDPSKGYVKGNVRVISFLANRCKNNETDPAVFERIAAYLRGEL